MRSAEFADLPLWKRAGAGALSGFGGVALLGYFTIWLFDFTISVLLPLVFRLALVVLGVGFVYLIATRML